MFKSHSHSIVTGSEPMTLPTKPAGKWNPASFEPVWSDTKVFEQGFQNMKGDQGNYCKGQLIGTKFGISAIAKADWNGGRCPTVAEMMQLNEPMAKAIAKQKYWDNIKGDKIQNQALAHLIFDITYGGSSGPLHVRQAINAIRGKGTVSEFKSLSLSDAEVNVINSIPSQLLFDKIVDIRRNFNEKSQYSTGLNNRLDTLSEKYAAVFAAAKKYKWPITIGFFGLAVGIYFVVKNY